MRSSRELIRLSKRKGKELYLSVWSFYRWGATWGHCKVKLAINANEVIFYFFRRREKWSTPRKASRCRVENQQTQPYMTQSPGIEPPVTLVGGELVVFFFHSHWKVNLFNILLVRFLSVIASIRPCNKGAAFDAMIWH